MGVYVLAGGRVGLLQSTPVAPVVGKIIIVMFLTDPVKFPVFR